MSSETKTDEVVKTLSERILDGTYASGHRLPAERELAQMFDVSRQTIRTALNRLQMENMLEIVPSSGAYVRGRLPKSVVGPSTPILNKKKDHEKPSNQESQKRETSLHYSSPSGLDFADARLAEKMRVEEKTQLWRRRSVYHEDRVPYRIVDSSYPADLLKNYPEYDDTPLQWLAKYTKDHSIPPEAIEHVSCRLPDEDEAYILNINKSQPILEIERWIFIENGRVFEYTHIIANPALQEFAYYYSSQNWDDLYKRGSYGLQTR